eukprot:Phypoly_transcript_03211.p1 GENE.Phypoly_transcript_03211~~Phypoly_transcript_03211.p1  ORF type:complete len:439 (+),score=120.89 Phypoly_transcript_03211:138-1454(+)
MGRTAKIVFTTDTGALFNFEIDATETIENVKALVEVETQILLAEQVLLHNGVELQNSKTLADYNIGNDEIIFVQRRMPQAQRPAQRTQQQPLSQTPTPEQFIDHVRNNPDLLQQILTNNPPLGEAVLASDVAQIKRFLDAMEENKRAQAAEHERRARLAAMDPFSAEYQKAIEEEIHQTNVNENMENAMEHTPESFGRVVMLYIDCKANNTPVKAFVDTGAQQTIMSVKCAERCGIMRLVDRRFSGVAKGVGTARIIGRVHMAPIQIGASFFPCSFTILEDQDMEFILGLDMLRRHQCTIDLNNNVLVIGSERAAFLPENAIPGLNESNEDIHPPVTSTSSSNPTPAATPAPTTTTTTPPPTSPTPTTTSPVPTPAPRPPVASPTPSPAPVSGGFQPNESDVQQLVSIGATRQEAIALLTQYRGNLELAASQFFGGGF